MKKTIIFLFATLLLLSCQPEKQSPAFDKAATAESARLMLHDYHAAIKREGLTGEFPYLDSSSDFFWVPPGYTSALPYDSVRTILEANAGAFTSVEFRWDTLQLFPLSAEIVNYTGIVTGKMVDTAGARIATSIIESGTLIRREEGWKLLSGQSAVLGQD
ncbi:MAG: hypothetical protein H6557_25730 [Lewinellaceae bacterium]|nr:hypothetical protein [Phaeodactylibacter sp.]MCB9040037.1 hypothetical protein [Lewinellaceae bacterium]